jgi:hypothetical protein
MQIRESFSDPCDVYDVKGDHGCGGCGSIKLTSGNLCFATAAEWTRTDVLKCHLYCGWELPVDCSRGKAAAEQLTTSKSGVIVITLPDIPEEVEETTTKTTATNPPTTSGTKPTGMTVRNHL